MGGYNNKGNKDKDGMFFKQDKQPTINIIIDPMEQIISTEDLALLKKSGYKQETIDKIIKIMDTVKLDVSAFSNSVDLSSSLVAAISANQSHSQPTKHFLLDEVYQPKIDTARIKKLDKTIDFILISIMGFLAVVGCSSNPTFGGQTYSWTSPEMRKFIVGLLIVPVLALFFAIKLSCDKSNLVHGDNDKAKLVKIVDSIAAKIDVLALQQEANNSKSNSL